jgi:hypothetical protein
VVLTITSEQQHADRRRIGRGLQRVQSLIQSALAIIGTAQSITHLQSVRPRICIMPRRQFTNQPTPDIFTHHPTADPSAPRVVPPAPRP